MNIHKHMHIIPLRREVKLPADHRPPPTSIPGPGILREKSSSAEKVAWIGIGLIIFAAFVGGAMVGLVFGH